MANKVCTSFTKVRKRHQEAANSLCTGGGGGEDRISNLPDAILGDVLSCFPTKVAVKTSVLSKRWRYVWTSVPCISIEDSLILPKNQTKFTNPKFKAHFVDFVRRVLRLNKVSSLQKCKLVCTGKYRRCFSEWISALTTRDIEELYLQNLAGINSDPRPRIELPPRLFTFNKLKILKLNDLFVLKVAISVSLASLKILHLVLVQYYDDISLKNLLAGCPVLEELDMKRDYDDNLKTLRIHSSSLKSFRLENEEEDQDENNLGIVLDAKNLERLDFSDRVTEYFNFNVTSLSSLVSVQLDLHPAYLSEVGDGDFSIEPLSKMCNTKYLQLSSSSMEWLEFTTLINLPMFHNLTHLVVGIVDSSWPVLPYLIECSPNLITFDFRLIRHGYLKADLDRVRFRTPKCLMLHLESIKIEGFCWSKNEMEMASYFLKNSTVLKKMAINYVQSCLSLEQSNLRKELFMLPKASTVCELKFDSYTSFFKEMTSFPFPNATKFGQELLLERVNAS